MFDLVLPMPPRVLEPNARPNRWEKARATKEYRLLCAWTAKEQVRRGPESSWPKLPLTAPVKAEVTFVVRNRRRDRDNLLASVKAMFDGLVDARVLVGDHSDVFDPGTAILLVGQREEVRVVLRGAE